MAQKFKVLVVEDECLIAMSICEDLRDIDVEPLQPVPKGEIAVQIALTEKPNLILMDISLAGGMDGIETAKRIKEKINIPVIFMSGFATDYIIEKANVINYLKFFEKPVTIEMLEPVINGLKSNYIQ